MDHLPDLLYSAAQTRQLDNIAIKEYGVAGYTLMQRAGEAVFDLLREKYPLAKRLLVCCGAGNNAGDGYVIARLAQVAGYQVKVCSMIHPDKLQDDAQTAYRDWKSLGHQLIDFDAALLDQVDLVIDALLGTGLERDVAGEWRVVVEHINQSRVPVISVDVPSGLNADTGSVMAVAVEADITLSFIALKKGLFTHQAADVCGELFFNDLQVAASVYKKVPASARLLKWSGHSSLLKPRKASCHKGQHGHVLVIGGDYGMAGAVRMAAEAALRTGAGLVSVITHPQHVTALVSARPELMVQGTESGDIPKALLGAASVIVIGPGLGRGDWSRRLLCQVLESHQAKVLDADALNLINPSDGPREDWVLTPHPGEAARLLGEPTEVIQQSRFSAAELLQLQYGGTLVLKGTGSLVQSADSLPGVCPYGNPGMATAGMGDVLSGIIGGLLAQGLPISEAAELGVLVHARAGDLAAKDGQRGLLATDLFASIRQLVN